MDQSEQPKPSWEEAFKGKDVVQGGELVDKLLSENVGIPVYKRNLEEKKTKFLVDRQPGEEDFTIREKNEQRTRLLGIIIPSGAKNEFVYLGINEGSFVFKANDTRGTEFHPDTASSFKISWEKFGDLLASYIRDGTPDNYCLTLKEEDDPNCFMETVVSAVQKERERLQSIRGKRAVVRAELLKKLFDEKN